MESEPAVGSSPAQRLSEAVRRLRGLSDPVAPWKAGSLPPPTASQKDLTLIRR